MLNRITATILFAAALLLGGCARSRITTEVRADGSWSRTDVFTGSPKKEGQMTPPIEDSFVLPKGAAWKSHEEMKDDNRVVTYQRAMAAGATLNGDLTIKDGAKVSLVNEVAVTRTGGRIEYRETLRWKGDAPDTMSLKPETLAQIKSALPKQMATDDNARAIAQKAPALLMPLMFGPGDPMLALFLVHPDLAEFRARQKIGGLMIKLLEDQFGSRMTVEQRRETARKLIGSSFASAKPSQPDPTDPKKSDKGLGGLNPLMFVLKMPGHIVSTNGEIDELSGEVYWAMFPEAAALKDLTLTAVCEPGQK